MDYIINESLVPHINDGTISLEEIHALVSIRDFVNRVSSKEYMHKSDINSIRERFGSAPTVTTWGDYFQTELAFEKVRSGEPDLVSAAGTVKFDIISSHTIFSEKDTAFFEWVERNFTACISHPSEMTDEEKEEALHLKILLDYYVNLGINGNFTQAELAWYMDYREQCAV